MADMNRRQFLGALASSAAGVALSRSLGGLIQAAQAAGPAEGAAGSARPNFVIILADDLGYADVACYGSEIIKTPAIDKLAQEGVRFTDCYAGCAVCSPSRAAMITGRNPYRMGIADYIPGASPVHLPVGEVTIPALLKQAGYATCFVGKWHLNGKINSPDQPQPGDHGFDHWLATQNNAAPSHRNPTNFVRNGQPLGPTDRYSPTIIVDEAMSWLDGLKGDQPFCLFVWFHNPHLPIAAADEFMKMYEKPPAASAPGKAGKGAKGGPAVYYADVTQMDHEIGRLMDKLDDIKARDKTFVMFTSDNGPEGQSGPGLATPLRGRKRALYDGGIRVPGVIRWPGRVKAGTTCAEPVSFVDLLPTVCAATGQPLPAGRTIDGESFLPLLEGKPMRRTRPMYWQYNKGPGGKTLALREGDWKIVADGQLQKVELYNLAQDIGEQNDLAAQQPQRAQQMAEALKKLRDDIAQERAQPKKP